MGTKPKEDDKKIISDIIVAQQELDALKKEQGIVEEERGIKRLISRHFERKEELSKIPLNKKKYTLLLLFTGIFGGHLFYSKRYPAAILYLLTCWTGFSFAMSLIDLLVVIPKQPNENGDIFI